LRAFLKDIIRHSSTKEGSSDVDAADGTGQRLMAHVELGGVATTKGRQRGTGRMSTLDIRWKKAQIVLVATMAISMLGTSGVPAAGAAHASKRLRSTSARPAWP